MVLGINNFFDARNKNAKVADFQDLDHLDGVSVSAVTANLYDQRRDDVVLFYFRNGANHASLYTKSSIVSENIKWNRKIKTKKINALLVNTRNANALTGSSGYEALKILSEELSKKLTDKQKLDEEDPKKISPESILFACTGTIGEKYPLDKIKNSIPNLIENIKYTQNKLIWMKAATGIKTTDLKPKLAMSECKIGNTPIKVYGIAKGSGMIFPNMATTLGFLFTDANLSSSILKNVLKENIETTFNAISCDGDTSTNDMVTIFATGKADNLVVKNFNDTKIKSFDLALNKLLLSLAKRVVSDGEGSSKFVAVNVKKCKSEIEAKNIAFSIANSPLVKTAIAGEDPNWGRIIMAIGKAGSKINLKKLSIKFGDLKIVQEGKLHQSYDEKKASAYMKNENIEFNIEIFTGSENFTVYTMDFTKKYVEINADYRS